MTDLEKEASELQAKLQNATPKDRIALQPQLDRVVTSLTMQGLPVSKALRRMNNTLKDEALDDMFENMPV